MADNIKYQEISLPVGQIRGRVRTTIYDEEYFSFEGIPFGQPPVGDLRFKSPRPAKSWTGVKDCLDSKIKPVQKHLFNGGVEGSEDCLYLNVYAKKLNTEKPLPVMVWIYGGGFHMGESTRTWYSPDYLMKEDVVVVCLTYRVHSLGFLSVEDPELEIPGNAGLKDQVLALKWVKEYIKHFNGDSENITVFGCSAGGVSTHYMTATKQTEGLFQKAICMSGSMLNFWAINPPKDRAYRLAVDNGYKGDNNDRQVVDFLRTLEPEQLVQNDIMSDEERQNGVLFTFCPCIEPYESDDCVIPVEPKEMLKTAWGNDIPILIGGCKDEGLLFYPQFKMAPESMKAINSDPESILTLEVRDKENKDLNIAKAKTLIQAHFGDKTPSEDCILESVELYGFKAFWHGFHRTFLSRLAYAKAPTYFYRFDFDSPTFNHFRKFICGDSLDKGVSHGDDVAYLFHSDFSWKLDKSTKEYKTIERMVDVFTTFAKTSNPNCSETENIQWLPLNKHEPDMGLNISDDLEYVVLPEKEKFLVWDALYEKNNLF